MDSRHEVYAYIPYYVRSLDIYPVQMLEHYLRTFRPPSGGFLLSAPLTTAVRPATFRTTSYSGFAAAFRSAYARACPLGGATALDRVASHSGRKSLAQWLFDAYASHKLIAHVGHWACREDALDAYYKSSPYTIIPQRHQQPLRQLIGS